MSEEHEMQPGDGFFVGNPDEVRKQIIEFQQRQKAINIDIRHGVERFLDSLDEDGLRSLKFILNATTHSDAAAHYHMGVIDAFLVKKFNICAACGVDHEKALLGDDGHALTDDPLLQQDDTGAMREYGVSPVPGSETGQVCCNNCGAVYVSLSDRMMKPPFEAGCEGCQRKSAWG